MKEKRVRHAINLITGIVLCLVLTTLTLFAQATPETDAGQKRLKRARALIAAHRLGAAAAELDAIRTATTDDAVRDVARIMLMSVYLEEGDYMRAQSLLEDTYKLRSVQSENSTRTYFALAGQAVNSAREHLGRYRSFGINTADKELPPEAVSDLDHVRMLLDRVAEQAREMSSQNGKSFDALGLLEEVANVRGPLARSKQERLQWQREVADAREKLAASEIRIASTGNLAINPISVASQPSVSNAPAASSSPSAPNHSTDTGTRKATAATAPENRNISSAAQSKRPADAAAGNSAPGERPVEIGSLIDKATQRVNPSYPQTAKMARVTGVVTVYLEVDESGSVTTVQRTNGPQLLKQAATDAARRWKFRPTVVDGQPVRVMGFINFNFTL
ncbi:MAG: periplasmic protein TonB [Acidobacteriota bacterium]|nr:periplasmic protein TonB [Acidobacteriota bacterium]